MKLPPFVVKWALPAFILALMMYFLPSMIEVWLAPYLGGIFGTGFGLVVAIMVALLAIWALRNLQRKSSV